VLESAEFSVVSNLLLTRVSGGTRQRHPFCQPLVDFFADSSNFGTIAKFAVTPEDTQNIGVSPSGFRRERGTLEIVHGGHQKTRQSMLFMLCNHQSSR
jgi:hypothetical protein